MGQRKLRSVPLWPCSLAFPITCRNMSLYTASTLLARQPCDPSSAFFGFMGVTSAIVFANLGAAYGTAKSGVGISSMGVMRPDMIMRSIIPVVMAGVLGIYGLITAVIINGKMESASYSAYSGYAHLGAGLTVGMSSLAAGLAIGIVGAVTASPTPSPSTRVTLSPTPSSGSTSLAVISL